MEFSLIDTFLKFFLIFALARKCLNFGILCVAPKSSNCNFDVVLKYSLDICSSNVIAIGCLTFKRWHGIAKRPKTGQSFDSVSLLMRFLDRNSVTCD